MKRFKKFLPLTLIFFNALPSLADPLQAALNSPDPCSEFRLDKIQDDKTEGSMFNVPVTDQGVYGICYAEAGLQMVDAYRFSKLKDTRVNVHAAAISSAIILSDQKKQSPIAGGQICDIVNFVKDNGYHDNFKLGLCALRSETREVVDSLAAFYSQYWTQINTETKRIKTSGVAPTAAQITAFNTFKKQTGDQLVKNVNQYLTLTHPNDYVLPNEAVILEMINDRIQRFIWAIVTYQCYSKDAAQSINLPSCNTEYVLQKPISDREARINALIKSSHGLPIGIGYCSPVLTVGKTYGGAYLDRAKNQIVCTPEIDKNGKTMPGNGLHASLIIGRRRDPDTKACQYLVRNSWGPRCMTESPHNTLPKAFQNDPTRPYTTSPKVIPAPIYSSDWDCDPEHKGNIWVNADELSKSIFKVNYFGK